MVEIGNIDRRSFLVETIGVAVVVFFIAVAVWSLASSEISNSVAIVAIVALAAIAGLFAMTLGRPEAVRARQSNRMLYLANRMFDAVSAGLNQDSAQLVCELLLPYTDAVAVSITDATDMLGYSGMGEGSEYHGPTIKDSPIVQKVFKTGSPLVVNNLEDYNLPKNRLLVSSLNEPLYIGENPVGVLSFYYHAADKMGDTQRSLADGLASLLSTQLTAGEVDRQTQLATRMELKALQAQINPHFLFNTINTIASLIRTEPARARDLLREFAVFYRRTLENSDDLITIGREIEQTERYFSFEMARFGEERIELICNVDPELDKLGVPSFIIQPLVENSVNHAMRDFGKLHISVTATKTDGIVEIVVEDDGVGIDPEVLPHVLDPGYGTGIGIALKNVDDRLKGYFGQDSGITMESDFGTGTKARLRLANAAMKESEKRQ